MRISYFLLTSLVATAFYSRAQVSSAAPDLNLDVSVLREHIYAGVPADLKYDRWDRRTYRFADIAANQISDLINSGAIYTDQPWLEAYLNKIMGQVLPPELKNDSIIHAYIIADASYNAFMTPSGSMFVNIGLIAEAPDEASIASVLAHEIAHYYKQHSLNGYVKAESGDFRSVLFRNNAESRFSIQNEFEADSLAMHW
ncbi:MAG: M48 family metallopeptidase, partial [Owenweeksia sp.]